jgi:hypothetical protein
LYFSSYTKFNIIKYETNIFLQETLHRHPLECEEKGDDDLEFSEPNSIKEKDGQIMEKQKVNRKSLFRNWPVMSSIIVYCVFSLHEVAYSEVWIVAAIFETSNYT